MFRSKWTAYMFVGIVMFGWLAQGNAQAPATLSVPSKTFVMRFAGDAPVEANLMPVALQRRITVVLPKVTVEVALKAISERSGLGLSYNRDVVQLRDVVSVDVREGTVADALRQVLRRQPLELLVSSTGEMALVPANPSAQDGQITGRVVHAKTKQPVAGAIVQREGVTTGRVITGEDGTFRITVPEGNVVLNIRAVGFTRQGKAVQVTSSGTTTVEIVLEPSANVLDELIVTGTVVATERKAIPNPITVFTAEDIEKRGITRIEELLQGEVPGVMAAEIGVSVYSGGEFTLGAMESTPVFSRGASTPGGGPSAATPLKTYIDGVELLDPAYLGTIDPQSIARIEIVTGPQAATVYGSGAMGGVMQIFTKKGSGSTSPDITLQLQYGILENSFSSGLTPTHNDALRISGGAGAVFSYAASVSYVYSGQWQPFLFSQRTGASLGGTHRWDAFTVSGSVNTMMGRNGTYTNYTPKMQLNSATGRMPPASTHVPSQLRSGSSSQTLSMAIDYVPFSNWQHNVTIGRSTNDFENTPVAPRFRVPGDSLYGASALVGHRTTYSYNTTIRLNSLENVNSTLTVGMTGSAGVQTRIAGCTATASATAFIECGSGSTVNRLGVARPRNDRSEGAFGTWQIGLFEHLFVTLGLRGEKNPNYGRAHKIDWTPRYGMAYAADYGPMTIKLLASYGKATRPPSPDARLGQTSTAPAYMPSEWPSQRANPELRPDYSRGPQGGIELYFGNRGFLAVNHYQQRITDFIIPIYVDSTLVTLLSNGNESYMRERQNVNGLQLSHRGWEGAGNINLGGLSFRGTWSYTRSKVRSFIANPFYGANNLGDSYVGIPSPHFGNLTISYARGGTSVSWATNFSGRVMGIGGQVVTGRFGTGERLREYIAQRRLTSWGGGYPMKGWAKSNINVVHRLNSRAAVTVNIKNIENRSDAIMPDDPALGRQSSFGISLRYPSR